MNLKITFKIFSLFLLVCFFGTADAQYCTSSGDTTDEWIEQVSIGSFNFVSNNDGGYADHTSQTIELSQNQTYNLTLTPGYASDTFDEHWRIWIDFDKNEIFESDELVYDLGGGQAGVINGSMSISANALTGTTRMRIAMKYIGTLSDGSTDSAAPAACGTFNFGEVEDYTVSINTGTTSGYCTAFGDTVDEWIDQVTIGTNNNNSGNNGGYGDFTNQNFELFQNQNYNLTLIPGYSGDSFDEHWRIWIDFDKDETFESNELVYDLGQGQAGTINANLSIPANAITGSTRMRIAMKYIGTLSDGTLDDDPPSPCGEINFGEVEDYTITIQSGSSSQYCTTFGDTSDEWIQQVSIGSFNNNSGNNGGYADLTNQTVTLSQNQSYDLSLTPGYSGDQFEEYWRIWIDYNKNNVFDGNELAFDAGSAQQGTLNNTLNIPPNATLGTTRMRIAMKYIGSLSDGTIDDAPPIACGEFNFGEVEDYNVVINTGSTGGGDLPVASFNSNVTTGTAPLTVNFFDQSTNNPTSWNWTFNGGSPSSSNVPNPVITYNEVGTYTVTLTVTNENGTDTEVKTNYIVVSQTAMEAPIANFTSNTNTGSAPLGVSFLDQSSNNPTSWSWTFNGGTPANSADQNPSVVYNTPGTYTVSLTATNANGTDTETKTAFIIVTNTASLPPVPDFVASITSGLAPLEVTFQDLTTNEPNVWNWSFPGGTPVVSNSQNPVITYNTPGSYVVTLTASNAAGTASETKTGYIIVNGVPPAANFSASVFTGPAPLSVTFFDQSSGNPTSWEWSLAGAIPPFSTEQNPTATYNNPGTYQVTLDVTNGFGMDTRTINNYITVTEPTGIEQIVNGNIVVGPNPNNGVFKVQAQLQKRSEVTLTLYNVLGNIMMQKTFNTSLIEEQINQSNLSSGLYLFEIKIGDIKKMYKLNIN